MAVNVDLRIDGHIAWITLNRPEKLNVIDAEMIADLRQCVEATRLHPVRVAIVTGAGDRAFCAGADVRMMRDLNPLMAREMIAALHGALKAIRDLPIPVIAAVNGHALGAGCELAMACDFAIASENATFGMPEIRVGIPSVIEAALMIGLAGVGRTKELMLTGDTIDAQEALRIGLVNRVLPQAELLSHVESVARKIASHSPVAVRLQKDLMGKWMQTDAETAMEFGINAFGLTFASGHPKEAMNAFLEKREPKFD